MGQTQSLVDAEGRRLDPTKGAGRKVHNDEKLRAAIAVKLHLKLGSEPDRSSYREALHSAFVSADVNGDGVIDYEEFCNAASSLGLGVSERDLQTTFARFDYNRDGTIEFKEVIDLLCPVLSVRQRRDGDYSQRAAAVTAYEKLMEAGGPHEELAVPTAHAARRAARGGGRRGGVRRGGEQCARAGGGQGV